MTTLFLSCALTAIACYLISRPRSIGADGVKDEVVEMARTRIASGRSGILVLIIVLCIGALCAFAVSGPRHATALTSRSVCVAAYEPASCYYRVDDDHYPHARYSP